MRTQEYVIHVLRESRKNYWELYILPGNYELTGKRLSEIRADAIKQDRQNFFKFIALHRGRKYAKQLAKATVMPNGVESITKKVKFNV